MFAIGVVLVVKGGDIFVDAAGWIARAFGVLLALVPMLIREKASRLQGVLLLAVYAGHLVIIL